MKCPQCVEEGLRSTLRDRGSVRHLLGWFPHYDEDGEYHSHDPNYLKTHYSCSNGHDFAMRREVPCPSKTCEYGKTEPSFLGMLDMRSKG